MVKPNEPITMVVGDRFEEFLANPGIMAASEAKRRIESENTDDLDLIAGQGLSVEFLELMGKQWYVPLPATRELTHKRHTKNVMTGEPERVENSRFRASLVLDERCETLEDHLTGQHIPAVALTEAARQTWTSVTEKFFPTGMAATRFVIDDLAAEFRNFVFPLPAVLEYEVLEHEKSPLQHRFRGAIRIFQSDVLAVKIDVRFRVVNEKLSAKQEAMAARQAVAALHLP